MARSLGKEDESGMNNPANILFFVATTPGAKIYRLLSKQ